MNELTLFHCPNSCSEGIALILRRIGVPFRLREINLAKREQLCPEFLALNPKGKVPALLRKDGTVLTEFSAIAFWLAKTYPEAALIGNSLESQTRALELLDFIVASIHMRGFTLLKVPQKFLNDPSAQEALRAFGRAEVVKNLESLSVVLADSQFLLETFCIADAAAFYVLRWAEQENIQMPQNLHALLSRLETFA